MQVGNLCKEEILEEKVETFQLYDMMSQAFKFGSFIREKGAPPKQDVERYLRATAHAADPKDKTWWPEVVTCMTLSTPDQWNIPRPKHHLDTSRKPPKPQA